MDSTSRDRITVDLRGLRAALFAQARASGVRPSDFVRSSLVASLAGSAPSVPAEPGSAAVTSTDRVRLTLRMARSDARATIRAAREAGLQPGDLVADLVARVPVHLVAQRPEHLAQLAASSAELSTLSRNIHHLTRLLREGSTRAAMEYRGMLDALAADVRTHLLLAADVLGRSKPRPMRNAKEV